MKIVVNFFRWQCLQVKLRGIVFGIVYRLIVVDHVLACQLIGKEWFFVQPGDARSYQHGVHGNLQLPNDQSSPFIGVGFSSPDF